MSDAGLVGAQPGRLVSMMDDEPNSERRRSAVVKEILYTLKGQAKENVNLHRSGADSLSDNERDEIYYQKQAKGETFLDGGNARYYKPIDTYEGRHRWDPNAEWTPEEEKRIIRKVRLTWTMSLVQ